MFYSDVGCYCSFSYQWCFGPAPKGECESVNADTIQVTVCDVTVCVCVCVWIMGVNHGRVRMEWTSAHTLLDGQVCAPLTSERSLEGVWAATSVVLCQLFNFQLFNFSTFNSIDLT